jgi:hypothetical protein
VPLALVIVRHGAGASLLEGQARLCPVEGLDLALFVHGKNDGVGRRIDIEAHDVAQLVHELRVIGQLEPATPMRLKAMAFQMRRTALALMPVALAIACPSWGIVERQRDDALDDHPPFSPRNDRPEEKPVMTEVAKKMACRRAAWRCGPREQCCRPTAADLRAGRHAGVGRGHPIHRRGRRADPCRSSRQGRASRHLCQVAPLLPGGDADARHISAGHGVLSKFIRNTLWNRFS